MDAQISPEAPPSPEHVATFRTDYRPPDWLVPTVDLRFTLDPATTRVQSKLVVERNPAADGRAPLRLAGDRLTPLGVWIDGQRTDDWSMDGSDLVIPLTSDRHEVGIDTELQPAANSKLMGLYESGGLLCTQCESEGFRRITFHPDRPDVLSVYRVRMSADKARYPVLLANGNPVESGEGDHGTHWAEWHDPFPKPSYLFALVAGDLAANRDTFTTMSGRQVELGIWVRQADLPRTHHAMASLKAAMKWDEDNYGREYDLDRFNIVAVDDFNFGAMENKGLNIFNSRYVLADTDTATDADFDAIAGVVAHEYFHNWSGDRVTCRDWFQLSLKEGFTVFRDQSFSADMTSAAVKRIDDVRLLRAAQFPEDAGPLAHPVRPDSYLEIANFYTATIYNKGAEVIRMMRTMLGADKYRAACDLYFDRHDGEAATCDDFVKAMEDGGGIDLTQFKRWYEQAGTPRVTAALVRDGDALALDLEQSVPPTPGQPAKQPMVIPLKTAVIGAESGRELVEERVILLTEPKQRVPLGPVAETPLLSINRDFSAPVIIDAARAAGELERLAEVDPNPFARFEATQDLMLRALVAGATGDHANADPAPVIAAMGATLRSNALDPSFKGEALIIPSESLIGDRLDTVDPDAVHTAREVLRRAVGAALADDLAAAQAQSAPGNDLSNDAKGLRRLRTVALGLIAAADPAKGAALAKAQYDAADNMTDRQGALVILAALDGPQREAALADFYDRYRRDTLVIDKWFAIQAGASRADTLDVVEALRAHGDFSLKNPNRLRAVAGSFASNPWVFHSGSGRGYRLLADLIVESDKLNPQVAARLVPPFGRWRRFAEPWSSGMREALESVLSAPGLSKDVFEQVSKSLG